MAQHFGTKNLDEKDCTLEILDQEHDKNKRNILEEAKQTPFKVVRKETEREQSVGTCEISQNIQLFGRNTQQAVHS